MKLGGNELRLELKNIMMGGYNQNIVLMCKIFKEQQKYCESVKGFFHILSSVFPLPLFLPSSISLALSHTHRNTETQRCRYPQTDIHT